MLRKILYATLLILITLLVIGYVALDINPAPKTEIASPGTEITPTNGDEAPAPRSPDVPLFNGLLYAFVLPILIIGLPWILLQLVLIRYVQPRGIDLSQIRIKARDGLFVEAAVSMTARRTITLASTRMTWDRVRSFMEKNVEQELIHRALQFNSLQDLEQNLKAVTEEFLKLKIVQELSTDFGVEVLRFNVETGYPQETMDALNRKAEAAAGGSAYLAYAAAANLDPASRECRELYKIYQETSGQVDAARNLGGGITNLAGVFNRREKTDSERGRDE